MDAKAKLTAHVNGATAKCQVAVSVQDDNDVDIEIRLQDQSLGSFRSTIKEEELDGRPKLVLDVMTKHPTLKRYIGSPPEFEGQNSLHWRVLLAEIIAEAIVRRVLERKYPVESEGMDAEGFFVELFQRTAELAPRIHRELVPVNEVESAGAAAPSPLLAQSPECPHSGAVPSTKVNTRPMPRPRTVGLLAALSLVAGAPVTNVEAAPATSAKAAPPEGSASLNRVGERGKPGKVIIYKAEGSSYQDASGYGVPVLHITGPRVHRSRGTRRKRGLARRTQRICVDIERWKFIPTNPGEGPNPWTLDRVLPECHRIRRGQYLDMPNWEERVQSYVSYGVQITIRWYARRRGGLYRLGRAVYDYDDPADFVCLTARCWTFSSGNSGAISFVY